MKNGQVVRHYKGNIYKVLCTARHTETMEPMVVYVGKDGKVWTRPESMFNDLVGLGDMRRFTPVEESLWG